MDAESLLDDVSEVLEENGAYYSDYADEFIRHAPDPEVLEYLGTIVTSVVVPILTNTVSDVIRDRLKDRRERKKEILRAIEDAIKESQRQAEPTNETKERAAEAAAQVLRQHGWPKNLADTDASSVVKRISLVLWNRER